jgi:hypothetical protein
MDKQVLQPRSDGGPAIQPLKVRGVKHTRSGLPKCKYQNRFVRGIRTNARAAQLRRIPHATQEAAARIHPIIPALQPQLPYDLLTQSA